MSLDPFCFEKVDLFVSAEDLPDMDGFFSRTDSFIVIYCRDRKDQNKLHKLHSTKVQEDQKNPSWPDPFWIDYYFEYRQHMVLKCYQKKNKHDIENEDEHVLIGEIEFTLSELMRGEGGKIEKTLSGGKGGGKGLIKVRGESQTDTRNNFCFTFTGSHLKKTDGFFSKSDPYFIMSRKNEDGTTTVVYQSEVVKEAQNPKWKPVKVPVNHLCGGDLRRPLVIEIRDDDGGGKYDEMGVTETSVHDLMSNPGAELEVMLKGKKEGCIHYKDVSMEENPTFLQFINGGAEISVVVALDYTASNGDPINPSSLHHIDPTGGSKSWNPYQLGITSICNIIEAYDTDKMYPVYGFGARVKQDDNTQPTAVQHCFPVADGEVHGVMGIMEAYEAAIKKVMMSGPTLFQEIIEKSGNIAEAANCTQEKQTYTILLILTDGVIDDMNPTKKALIKACNQPLSVLIIGIGPEDFADMRTLDSDGEMLSAGGMTAERDIVQFIDMNPESQSSVDGWMNLSQKVLAEIPDQFLAYMKMKGIVPNPKK